MTEQEFAGLFDAEEEALLVELGDTLRATPQLKLPADFAHQTARAAEQRFQRLGWLSKLTVGLEPVLSSPVASPKAFPVTVALLGATLLGGLLGKAAYLGVGLMGLVSCWRTLEYFCLPGLGPTARSGKVSLNFSFYLLPFTAVVLVAIGSGALVAGLSSISLNFQSMSGNGLFLGPAAGLAVWLYLLSALLPSWRALQRQSIGRATWVYPVQFLHALVVGLFTSLLAQFHEPNCSLVWVWGVVLLLAFVISSSTSNTPTLEEEGRPALWRALSKTVRSLLIGGLAIGAVLVCAYEASLTRKIDQPELYQATLAEVRDWVKAQEAIPSQRNGWVELRSAMTYRGQQQPELLLQMKAGSRVYEPEIEKRYWDAPNAREKWEKARDEFRKALPALGSALAKPEFSPVATQGLKIQALVPNFLAARGVSQGLAGLTSDAIRRGQAEEALDYQLINLAWSSKMTHQGSLIGLMISVSQQKVALDGVESWVFECHPDAAQLRRLLAGLLSAEFARTSFQTHMKREVYLIDLAFSQLLENGQGGFKEVGLAEGRWGWMVKLMPSSYWRSEHKAYLNVMLANQTDLAELGRPGDQNPAELLPFSFAASQLAPMPFRAQAQFMACLGRFK
ncbi:hypothetical protein JST97_31320, partial [bacterium]|nr:hypothetical protein [bacterium]